MVVRIFYFLFISVALFFTFLTLSSVLSKICFNLMIRPHRDICFIYIYATRRRVFKIVTEKLNANIALSVLLLVINDEVEFHLSVIIVVIIIIINHYNNETIDNKGNNPTKNIFGRRVEFDRTICTQCYLTFCIMLKANMRTSKILTDG